MACGKLWTCYRWAIMSDPDNNALTPQQERFCQLVVERDNLSAAYRGAYDVAKTTGWAVVGNNASRLAKQPEVAKRIQELRDAAAASTAIPSLAERIREQRELEQANPADIISLRWVNCRHCRGLDHHFQWKDEHEYAGAFDNAMAMKAQPPDMFGGFGYNGTLDPVNECPNCWGIGEQRPFIADTSKLTGGAKRLYKGVKIKGNGDIEVLLHDQQKATDMLNRIQGAYKDGAPAAATTPHGAAADAVAAAATPEERQRAYLRLVSA